MELDPDTAWKALATHDARFDGRFFVGVTSTRIYCRPVCRVRTPRKENCRFYPNAALAEQAGFRPCLRCRPELAPGLSLMDSSQVLAQHAARMIDHAVRVGAAVRMPELAARLGVTERHLRRVFAQAHGVSPIDYLTTQRLLQAKQLLTDTDLPVTEVALACGFESLRRFNAVFAEQVRLKPTELRRASGAVRPASGAGEGLRVRLGYRPPYDVDSMLAFWEQRTLAGVEEVQGRIIRRTWSAPRAAGDEAGQAGRAAAPARGWVEIEFLAERHEVELRASANLAAHSGQLVEAARHALDLDADPAHMAPLLATLAALHPASAMAAGLRMPGSFDGFETAARIVLGQQVTVAAARTLTRRLIDRFGTPVDTPWPGLHALLPRRRRDRRRHARFDRRAGHRAPARGRAAGARAVPSSTACRCTAARRWPPRRKPCWPCPASATGRRSCSRCACWAGPTPSRPPTSACSRRWASRRRATRRRPSRWPRTGDPGARMP